MGSDGREGRFCHKEIKGSSIVIKERRYFFNSRIRFSASETVFTHPSIPTFSLGCNTCPSQLAIVGVPGTRSLNRMVPVPSSCSSA